MSGASRSWPRVSRDLGGESVPFAVNSSKSKKETTALAVRAFGRDHWTTDEEHTIRYYNSDRGYWMYAKSYERLKDGKQLKFEPFALISWSRDRRSLKTITSDKAVIDLDQPLGLANKSDTPIHVIHAMIEGNVRLRDDKATRIPDDDLVIGPMAYIEYDEADLEIRSDREVVIQDVDMRVTGTGFLIKLRPKNETDPGTGFPGAKTAYLRRDVHIVMNDVGRSGILPGTARPEQAQGDKTPLDLRCAGQMQVDLPRERRYPPTFVGPPQPPGTTLATFTRDVVVLRGKLHQMPDQLNCDDLRLILIQAEKAPAARAGPRAEPGKDDLLAAAPDLSQEEDSGGGLGADPPPRRGHWARRLAPVEVGRPDGPVQRADPQEADPRAGRRDLLPGRRHHPAPGREARARQGRPRHGQGPVRHDDPDDRRGDLRRRPEQERRHSRGPRARRPRDPAGPRPARRAEGNLGRPAHPPDRRGRRQGGPEEDHPDCATPSSST